MTTPVAPAEVSAAETLVRRHLGFPSLRAGQGEILARVLRGEDVLAILPTGGGKSVCYQLPGVLSKGVTLVVSPLVALMKDQLDSLPPPMRAAATSVTSELPPREVRARLAEVGEGRYRLVYVAPERLRQTWVLEALKRAGVARFVVDEAHCVSVWGHDFRPDYLNLAAARKALGNPQLLAFTATAPPRVEQDIVGRLGSMTVVRASVDRPNLRLEAILAKDADEKLGHLLALCKETTGPGVVYASSRAKCEQLAAALQGAKVDALAYHAGLPDRGARQDAFMRGEAAVLVATVAFGMGVDKGDIRFVFHHDPASSVENYYQEAGRAGRDGGPARCVLLATAADGGTLKQRARSDLPSQALVEQVWGLVLAGHAGDGYAFVDPDALKQLAGEDTTPRVALSALAEAGALERLPDAPRFVRLRRPALGLPTDREVGLFELAAALGVPPERAEEAALERLGADGFATSERGLLVRLTGMDPAKVEDVLARYAKLATRRADEIMAYAREKGCRHAHLRRHFGEEPPTRCANCDNCLGVEHAAPVAQDDESAARALLFALATVGRGVGETNLLLYVRGDAGAPPWLVDRPSFGALAFRSESKLRSLLRELEGRGFVEKQQLSHGGFALRLTPAGERAMGEKAPIAAEPRGKQEGSARETSLETPLPPDALARFERLRAWRRATADAEGVPPYVVAHDSTLREIATACPKDMRALGAVKGMGPKKCEKYGAGILDITAEGD